MLKIKFNDSKKYYPCEIEQNGNIVTLKGITVRDTSGFISYSMSGRVLNNRSNYATVYRVLDNAIQYSCDGSVYHEPTRDITVSVSWVNDEPEDRPEGVAVTVNKGSETESLNLSADNDWKYTYEDIPVSTPDYTVTAGEVKGYEQTINGTTISYEIPNPIPSTQEQLDNLFDVVCELDERVYALEESEV